MPRAAPLDRWPRAAQSCFLAGLTALIGCVSEGEEPPLICADGFVWDDTSEFCLEQALVPIEGDVLVSTEQAMHALCAQGDAVTGDLVIAPGVVDLDPLDCVREVGGSIVIEDVPGLTSASLPRLRRVGKDLRVQVDPDLLELRLPALESTGGAVVVQYDPRLEVLEAPVLASTGAFLSIYSNAALQEVSLPTLATVGPVDRSANQVLYVRLNNAATRISMPELTRVSGVLKLSSNDSVTELDLGRLETLGMGMYLSYNRQLRSLTIPVAEVGGFVYFDHTSATSIDLPRLESVGASFNVIFNEDLTAISAPSLSRIGDALIIADNPNLSQVVIDAFVGGIEEVGGPTRVEGNGAR